MLEKGQETTSGSSTPVDKAVKSVQALTRSKHSSNSNSSIKLSTASEKHQVHNRSPTSESAPKVSIKNRETSSGFGVKAKSPTGSGREKIST